MQIQRLATDEGERLRRIRLRSLRDAPDAFASTFEESAARPPESWTKQLAELATFVAVIEGADVGIVRGTRHEGHVGAAILLSLWVAPETRGRGVGQALIDAVVEWARSEGFARLVLDVADHNTAALHLYVRKGFKATGQTNALPPPREHIREHQRALDL